MPPQLVMAIAVEQAPHQIEQRYARQTRRSLLSAVMVAAIAFLSAQTCAAEEGFTPVELGEAPIFERASAIGAVRYTPGRGLRIGDTGLTIGGYTNLTVERREGAPGELELEDFSAFVIWDPTPRFHFFFELEYEDVFDVDTQGRVGSPDDRLTAERLYADLAFSDLVNLRTGVFLTPVGRWNVIHAPPLQWTTGQPLVTELPFDPSLTGVMLFGSLFTETGALTYALYDQFADPIEGNPEFEAAQHSLGARIEYDADASWSVGASYLAARRAGTWRHLAGLDGLWTYRRLELMGEFALEDGPGGDGQWGVYLQSVFQLTSRIYLVGRFEHYDSPAPDPRVNLFTFGLAFRPLPAIVLKAEYLLADRTAPEAEPGLYASIATLF